MPTISKYLVIAGFILILVGLVSWPLMAYFKLGQLPGDFQYKSEHVSVYFPVASCLIISIIGSIIYHYLSK